LGFAQELRREGKYSATSPLDVVRIAEITDSDSDAKVLKTLGF
jgi:hypothetical protein